MPTKKHNLLLHRAFQYLGIILIMAAMGGGYWYWKNAQAGLNINTSQEGTLSNGLVGYWSFDGNDISGTTAYDRSGQGNNGTLANNPTKTIGEVGQALSFDGINDYASVPNSSVYNFAYNEDFSVGVWFKAPTNQNNTTAVSNIILQKWLNTGGYPYAIRILNQTYGTPADRGKLYAVRFDGTNNPIVKSSALLNDNAWHRVDFIKRGSVLELYIDGSLDATATDTTTGTTTNSNPIYMGSEAGTSYYYTGSLDEPRIYNRALSVSEIWDLYQMGNPDHVNAADSQIDPLEKGLIGYWKLDDASGTSATDSSGNAKTGTLTNGPTWTTGRIGGAASFDGTDDVIVPAMESGTRQGTISAWVKPSFTLSSADYRNITYSDFNGSCDHVLLQFDTFGNKWGFNAKGGCVGPAEIYSSAVTSNTDLQQWHHIVGTWDGLNGIERLYVDGSKVNEATSSAFTIGSVQYTIGGSGWKTWQGDIDEFRTYNRALSADEVAKLYKQTAPDNPDTGLVGYWPFNGPDVSGTTAYDRSGKGNNGTINGSVVTAGIAGQALSFNGSSDYVSIPDSAPLSPTAQMTVSIWINRTENAYLNDRDIISKSQSGSRSWGTNARADGGFNFYIANALTDTGSNYASTGANIIQQGMWTHLMFVFDGSGSGNADRAKIYVNGVQQALTFTGTINSSLQDSVGPVVIGDNEYGGYHRMKGYVDEPRIYNRALSASEIWSLYQSGKPDEVNTGASQADPLEKGLVGYWKLDDASGTNATDSSGNANTGTLTNGPTWTTGQIGGATTFDGADDYVSIPDSSPVSVTSRISVSAWVNNSQIQTNTYGGAVIKKRNSATDSYQLLVVNSSGNKVKFTVDTTSPVDCLGTTAMSNGVWYHLMGTWDGVTVRVYVNGVLEASCAQSGSMFDTGDVVGIGGHSESGHFFFGSIDDTRIYNRALSADEVTKLYKTTAPDDPDTGLVGYWSFNGPDLSGTTAYDRSGKGNNGTLTNGPRVIPGKAGQGLIFDGSDDRINYGNISTLKPSFPFTVMAWVKGTGGAAFSNGKGEYFCSPATPYADNYSGIVFYMNGGVAGGNTAGQSSSNRFERAASVSAADGQWHHIAAVLQAGNNINLYKDGVLNNGSYDDGTATTIAYDTRPVLVGAAYGCGYMYHANGTIDEVRIYNRVLTAAEITAIYNAGR